MQTELYELLAKLAPTLFNFKPTDRKNQVQSERLFACAALLVVQGNAPMTSAVLTKGMNLSHSSACDRMMSLREAGFLIEAADVAEVPEGKRRHLYMFNIPGNDDLLRAAWAESRERQAPTSKAQTLKLLTSLLSDPSVRGLVEEIITNPDKDLAAH